MILESKDNPSLLLFLISKTQLRIDFAKGHSRTFHECNTCRSGLPKGKVTGMDEPCVLQATIQKYYYYCHCYCCSYGVFDKHWRAEIQVYFLARALSVELSVPFNIL